MRTLLFFKAAWCAPCKRMSPIVDKVLEELESPIDLQFVDIDENREAVKQYEVTSVPTFLLVENGEVIDRLSGMQSAYNFREFLTK